MTRPTNFGERPPLVETVAHLRTSSGVPVGVPLTITNQADEARVFLVSALGVDTTWVPMPTPSVVVGPGDSIRAELTVRPADGTLAARYPLVLTVQALDPATGAPRSATTVDNIDLVVGAPGQISIALDPPDSRALYSRKFFVVLQNTGLQPETVHLDARAPYSTAVDVTRHPVVVPPQSAVRVPGRLTVSRPTLFRRNIRHAYSVTARTSGAPKHVEGSLTARSLIGPTGAKVVSILIIVAIWVTLALVFVPKLADKIRKPSNNAAGTQTLTVKPPAGGKGAKKGGGGQSGGGSGGGQGTSGSGGSGSGGSGGSGGSAASAGSGTPANIQLTGTVAGTSPAGVLVSLSPTTFGSSATQGATGVGTTTQDASDTAIGKLTPQAFAQTPLHPTADQSVKLGPDGSYTFAKVHTVGFYILSISKPGYQTQRYVIDPSSAAAIAPMKIMLAAGTGSLHGVVRDTAGGNVGAATVTITDGTNTITTSTISKGHGIGTWSVTGLSTPSSYLVSASHDGLGVASRLVSLPAGGSAAADLAMSSGVATLSGVVRSMIGGHNTPLGGMQVSATDGTTTRTTTTTTAGTQTGTFVLPALTLGTWTVTVSGDGYQLQTQQIKVVAGKGLPKLKLQLTASTVTVTGSVKGSNGPLNSAGLIMFNASNTYKQTTLRNGRFRFENVAPGTYTLTAEYSGYSSESQTVKAEIGASTKRAAFTLSTYHVTHTSTIVGYVANSISSSGSFGCLYDAAHNPITGCTVWWQLFDSSGNPVSTTLNPTVDNALKPSRDVTNLNGPVPYELSMNPKQGDGLQPGQYTLVVSSLGFTPAKVRVQVPLNGPAALPEISMLPGNKIGGQIKAPGNIDDLTIGTDPAVHNCMLALPLGNTIVDPGHFYCDQAQADAAKATDPKAAGPDDALKNASDCVFTGTAEPAVAPSSNGGSYGLTGLCDGTYTLYPIIGNNAYVHPDPASAITITVNNGQTAEYDPVIDRLPILDATVNNLDANGVPQLDTNAPVTFTCDDGTSVSATTDASTGVAKFYGIPQGLKQGCEISQLSGTDRFTTAVNDQFMADNQEYTTAATLVNSTTSLLGRIVSKFGDSDTNDMSGVPVTIAGITHYIGDTAQTDQAGAVTNAQGCFAVMATPVDSLDAGSTSADTDCGTLTKQNIIALSTTKDAVTISTDPSVQTQALSPTPITLTRIDVATTSSTTTPVTTSGTIAPVTSVAEQSVTAAPVNLAGLSFLSVDASGNPIVADNTNKLSFAGANLTATIAQANGAGTITAGVTSTGAITWQDSNIAGANLVWPGTYSYKLTVPGYDPYGTAAAGAPPHPIQGTMTCGYNDFDQSYACTLDNQKALALGNLTGNVLAGGSPVSNADVYLDRCLGPLLSDCTAAPSPAVHACPAFTSTLPYHTTTDSSGNYDFSLPTGRQITPGPYRLIVCSPSNAAYSFPVSITGGSQAAQNVTLQQLGGISGTVVGAGNTLLTSVPVTLTCLDTGCTQPTITTSTDSSGRYTFSNGTDGTRFLDPGNYRVSVQPVGYQEFHVDVAVQLDHTYPTELDPQAFGGFSGLVTHLDSNGNPAPIVGASVSLHCVSAAGATLTCPASDPTPTATNVNGRFSFTGGTDNVAFFLVPGSWNVTVSAPGYSDLVLDGANAQTIGAGSNDNSNLVMTPLGSLTGTVTDAITTGKAVVGATVSATCVGDCTGVPAVANTVTDATGTYTFGTTGAPNVFAYRDWDIAVSAPSVGYARTIKHATVTFDSQHINQSQAFTLQPLGTITGTVTDTITDPTNPTPISGAIVSASCVSHCDGVAPVSSTSTNGVGRFTFGPTGAPQVFGYGDWQITITANGYSTGGTAAGAPISFDLTNPNVDQAFTLAPRGTLSGTIFGSTVGTQQLSGVPVTLTQCDPNSTDPVTTTTCTTTGAPKTARTDTSGNYSIAGPSGIGILDTGPWLLSASATGFQTQTKVVDISAGPNTTGGDLTLDYQPVDLPVEVVVTSTSAITKHATVTFKPAGGVGPQATVTGTNATDTDGTTPVYLGTGLMPTAYNITVAPGSTTGAGATIQTVITTVSIPPTNSPAGGGDGRAPVLTVYVSLLDFAVTGTINGETDNATTHPLNTISVQLLNSSDPTDVATNANDVPITATTAADGTFTLAHVPNGTYYASINEPGGVVPSDGFLGSVYGPFTVLNSIASISPPVLTAARQTVTVTVHRNKDDNLSSAAPTLTDDAATAHWVPRLSPTVGTTTDTTVSYTFRTVPDGCWVFNLNPNSGLTVATHFGTATIDSASHSGNCATGFQVSGLDGANDATPSYTIDENALALAPTTLATDGASLSTVHVVVKQSGTTKFTQDIAPNGGSQTIYLPDGTYSIGLSAADTTTWPTPAATPVTLPVTGSTTVTPTLLMTEATGSLKFTFTNALNVAVSLKCRVVIQEQLSPNCTTTATPTVHDTGSGVVISNLAPGAWTILFSGTTVGTPPGSVGGTQPVTIGPGSQASVTLP